MTVYLVIWKGLILVALACNSCAELTELIILNMQKYSDK